MVGFPEDDPWTNPKSGLDRYWIEEFAEGGFSSYRSLVGEAIRISTLAGIPRWTWLKDQPYCLAWDILPYTDFVQPLSVPGLEPTQSMNSWERVLIKSANGGSKWSISAELGGS
ncbi:hypothetical protein DSO57_1000945 [Entomophthora muscae]|uniref:Uncharacterized protein n=1 Tax=Entomophthora muscae TaxID=34485 RepID=A0ACC2TK84_9FUNG|nr:hypothetical protein DSO57_1000945 [Entomophthora muscae]